MVRPLGADAMHSGGRTGTARPLARGMTKGWKGWALYEARSCSIVIEVRLGRDSGETPPAVDPISSQGRSSTRWPWRVFVLRTAPGEARGTASRMRLGRVSSCGGIPLPPAHPCEVALQLGS